MKKGVGMLIESCHLLRVKGSGTGQPMYSLLQTIVGYKLSSLHYRAQPVPDFVLVGGYYLRIVG